MRGLWNLENERGGLMDVQVQTPLPQILRSSLPAQLQDPLLITRPK